MGCLQAMLWTSQIIAYVVNPSESNLDYKTENSLEYPRLVKIVLSLYQPYAVVERQLPRPVYQQNKVHSSSFISWLPGLYQRIRIEQISVQN